MANYIESDAENKGKWLEQAMHSNFLFLDLQQQFSFMDGWVYQQPTKWSLCHALLCWQNKNMLQPKTDEDVMAGLQSKFQTKCGWQKDGRTDWHLDIINP